MKASTPRREAQAKQTFTELLEEAGLTAAKIEVETAVSMATTYRARRGTVPGPLHLRALADLLKKPVEFVRASIQRERAKGAA